MAYGPGFEELIDSHFVHIIRDTFSRDETLNLTIYGEDEDDLLNEFRKPQHGIESWGLFTSPDPNKVSEVSYAHYWKIGMENSWFGTDFSRLFISRDYTPSSWLGSDALGVARCIYGFLKDEGYVVLINSGIDTEPFGRMFNVREDIVDNLERFTMLKYEDVKVFQK